MLIRLTEIQRLEMENEAMELRLHQFKDSMARQKASRTAANPNLDSVWSGGALKRGSLGSYAKDVLKTKPKGYRGVGAEGNGCLKVDKKIKSNNIAANITSLKPVPPPIGLLPKNQPVKRMVRFDLFSGRSQLTFKHMAKMINYRR
jgi:hypothetical protein